MSSPKVKFPAPSAEERALQREQVELLWQQREALSEQLRQQQLLAPLLFEAAGIKPIYGSSEDIGQQRDAIDRQIADLEQRRLPTGALDPQAELEINRLRQQRNALTTGRPPIVGYERIEDPLDPLRKETEQRFLERGLAALKGELPVNPALLTQLEQEERLLREQFRRQLGAGYETSTPFREAFDRFGRQRTDVLEASRRGDLSLAEALGLSREASNQQRLAHMIAQAAGINQAGIGGALTLGQAAQGYQSPLGNLFRNRAAQFGARLENFRYDAYANPFTAQGVQRNLHEGALAFLSTATVKKDITPLDRQGATALQKLRDTPVYRWRYQWEGPERTPHVGPILELSPEEIRADEHHLSLSDYLGLTHAAVQELDRDVQSLRRAVRRR